MTLDEMVEKGAAALELNRMTITDLRTGQPIQLPGGHVIVRVYGAARAVLDAAGVEELAVEFNAWEEERDRADAEEARADCAVEHLRAVLPLIWTGTDARVNAARAFVECLAVPQADAKEAE